MRTVRRLACRPSMESPGVALNMASTVPGGKYPSMKNRIVNAEAKSIGTMTMTHFVQDVVLSRGPAAKA